MQKLDNKYISKIDDYLKHNCRLLEKKLLDYHFKDAKAKQVMIALRLYQNQDGGFGQGLESDFRLPDSSPMATSIGVRILDELIHSKEAKRRMKQAFRYFESSYDEERNGWYAVPKEVNEYPHAPWWHYDEKDEMSVIDKNWGNPSAEIIAYLYKYKQYINKLDIKKLLDHAVKYINNKEEFNSENELYCYQKLYKVVPDDYKIQMKESIARGIDQVIEYDESKWDEYVPTPLDFVSYPDQEKFNIKEDKIKSNLDFYVSLIEENTIIDPPWGKDIYEDGLKAAYKEWKGVLTLEALKKLDNFNRIKE